MTFILHPLSHYNSIAEPCARFLLSLLDDISIDFPSHFILSLIDVYRDTATHDKLIFLLVRIIHHVSISYLESTHFYVMCAIDATTIQRSEAQFQSRRPWTETVIPLASFAPSTSAPSSSAGGVTLEAIMAHHVCMDSRLDTLSDKLYQVNTRVSYIARWQTAIGGFTAYTSPSPSASEDESDDGSGSDDADEDNGVSSPSDDETTAWVTYPLSFVTKRESSFGMRVVIYIGGRLA